MTNRQTTRWQFLPDMKEILKYFGGFLMEVNVSSMSSEATAIRDLERSWNSTASLFTWRSAALAGVLFFLIYYYKWEFNDLAWALWINMIWTGIALIIANAVLTLFDVLDRSHPVRFVFGFVFAFVPLFFASGN